MTGFLTLFYVCVFVSVRLSVYYFLLVSFSFLPFFLFFFLLNKQKNSVTSIKWQKLPFSKSKSDLIILSSCASVRPIASIFISFPSSDLDAAAPSPSPLPIRPPRIFLKCRSDLFFSRCQKLQALCFFSPLARFRLLPLTPLSFTPPHFLGFPSPALGGKPFSRWTTRARKWPSFCPAVATAAVFEAFPQWQRRRKCMINSVHVGGPLGSVPS